MNIGSGCSFSQQSFLVDSSLSGKEGVERRFLESSKGRTGVKFEPDYRTSTIRRLEEFSNIGIYEWKTALAEENLRGNQLWRLVPPLRSGDRAVLFRMMSEPSRAPISKGIIERLRRLQKEVGQAKSKGQSSAVPAAPAPIREGKKAKKKRPDVEVDVDAYALDDRGICLNFPSEAHAYSEFTPYLEESKKWLFPFDRSTFDQISSDAVGEVGVANSIRVVQSLLYQNETAKKLRDMVKQLESERVGLQSEIDGLKAALAESEAFAADRLEQLNARDLEADCYRSISVELDRVRGQLKLSQKENEIIALKTEIRVTADLLRKVQAGKSDWDFEQAYTDEKELQQTDDPEACVASPSGEVADDFDDRFTVGDYLGVQPGVEEFGPDQSGR